MKKIPYWADPVDQHAEARQYDADLRFRDEERRSRDVVPSDWDSDEIEEENRKAAEALADDPEVAAWRAREAEGCDGPF